MTNTAQCEAHQLIDLLTQQPTQMACRLVEALGADIPRKRVADGGVKDLGLGKIPHHPDLLYGDQAQSRLIHLVMNQAREFPLQLRANPVDTLKIP